MAVAKECPVHLAELRLSREQSVAGAVGDDRIRQIAGEKALEIAGVLRVELFLNGIHGALVKD